MSSEGWICSIRAGQAPGISEMKHDSEIAVDILDIGAATAFLCSPFAKLIIGGTIDVDGGHNIRG